VPTTGKIHYVRNVTHANSAFEPTTRETLRNWLTLWNTTSYE
jgi:hypothetical protein